MRLQSYLTFELFSLHTPGFLLSSRFNVAVVKISDYHPLLGSLVDRSFVIEHFKCHFLKLQYALNFNNIEHASIWL